MSQATGEITQSSATPMRVRESRRGLDWLAHGLRGVVAFFFAVAAITKLGDLAAFAKEIRQYRVVPDMWSEAIANIVPWLELVTAAMLIAGFWRREARILILGMLLWFTALKIMVMVQGREIKCGCFGDSILTEIFSGTWGLVLNFVLIGCLFADAWWSAARSGTRAPRTDN